MLLIDEKSQKRQTSLEHSITPQTPSHTCQFFFFSPNGSSDRPPPAHVTWQRWNWTDDRLRQRATATTSVFWHPVSFSHMPGVQMIAPICPLKPVSFCFLHKKDQPAITCRSWEQLHKKKKQFLSKTIKMVFFLLAVQCCHKCQRAEVTVFKYFTLLLAVFCCSWVVLHAFIVANWFVSPPSHTQDLKA